MTETPEYVIKFLNFIREENWHEALIPSITVFSDSKHTVQDIDNLLMAVTKRVETFLKNSILQFQGSTSKSKYYGIRLLDYAIDCHLIKKKEEPLYHLIYWILKEPRNISHHIFSLYPLKTLKLFMLEVDHAIGSLDDLLKSGLKARFNLTIDEEHSEIAFYNVKVYSPNNELLPLDEKVEGYLYFSDERNIPVSLKPNGNGSRFGSYCYKGEAAGTIWARVGGVYQGERFLAPASSSAFLSPDYGTCPFCNSDIKPGSSICPYCGKRLRIS